MPDFLIAYHFPANTGFAIEPLEIAFFQVVKEFLGGRGQVHLGYTNYSNGHPRWLTDATVPLVEVDYSCSSAQAGDALKEHLRTNDIQHVFAFDLSVGARICALFHDAGVKEVLSYWGAPMSSVNSGFKLWLKRLQVSFSSDKPDHFIFESYGMRKTATHGRGIRKSDTSVVRLGIDVEKFTVNTDKTYVYEQIGIPAGRKIFFYAGHMEERKGVKVIVEAAASLVNERGLQAVHFLICGNREGEKEVFDPLYKGTAAEDYITFAGYRSDISQLMPGCYAGIIASTGWDSFPRSSLEMAAAGLPLLVSDLIGLNETVEDQKTGLLFPTGDSEALADKIEYLLGNPDIRDELSEKAVARVSSQFTLEIQHRNLLELLRGQITS